MEPSEQTNAGRRAKCVYGSVLATIRRAVDATGESPRMVVLPDRDVDDLQWYFGDGIAMSVKGVPLVKASAMACPAIILKSHCGRPVVP